jgi:hypothetical protein
MAVSSGALAGIGGAAPHRTVVEIEGPGFLINGKPTYQGRSFRGMKVEGLLMNSRMVQAVFDDTNPETRVRWRYPDTGKWDPERNVLEFISAMPTWREHGVLSFTVNLQGGSPQGYSRQQPWSNTGIAPDGSLVPAYVQRMRRVLDQADKLGMVPILGIFYFGQDQRVVDEAAVRRAVSSTVEWLLDTGYRNILLEINNETDVASYDHEILKPPRIHELIEMAKGIMKNGRRLLVGTSYGGGTVPRPNVVKSSDFLLMHGNGVKDPNRIRQMVVEARRVDGYRSMPILFNEDDHFDFDKDDNNMLAALSQYASWGYFDPGESNYRDGYQCPPVNWGINTERKRSFFALTRMITAS